VIVAFLHGLAPIILVSIFDDLGALIVAIIAIIWGTVMLVLSIPSIVANLHVGGSKQARAQVMRRPLMRSGTSRIQWDLSPLAHGARGSPVTRSRVSAS
jgi:hypothetical protein